MKQPNAACAAFCSWMLNVSEQRLSSPQRILVQLVYDAAIAVTPVTNQQWFNFNLFSAWRNPFYIVYRDYATDLPADLLTDLIASYSLDGNADSSAPAYDGVTVAGTYAPAYGLINDGIRMAVNGDRVQIPSITMSSDFTFLVWVNVTAPAVGYGPIFSNDFNDVGFYYNKATGALSFYTSTYMDSTLLLPTGNWALAGFQLSGGVLSFVLNTTVQPSVLSPTLLYPIIRMFGDSYGRFSVADFDIASAWSKVLTTVEIAAYYNGGTGIQYPF